MNKKIDDKNQIKIGNDIYKNITIVDSEGQPVVIITASEITELNGYQVLFNSGED